MYKIKDLPVDERPRERLLNVGVNNLSDKELISIIHRIKLVLDYNKHYSIDAFMNDINVLIIRNPSLTRKIKRMVQDNYILKLSNNGGKTPNLQPVPIPQRLYVV